MLFQVLRWLPCLQPQTIPPSFLGVLFLSRWECFFSCLCEKSYSFVFRDSDGVQDSPFSCGKPYLLHVIFASSVHIGCFSHYRLFSQSRFHILHCHRFYFSCRNHSKFSIPLSLFISFSCTTTSGETSWNMVPSFLTNFPYSCIIAAFIFTFSTSTLLPFP